MRNGSRLLIRRTSAYDGNPVTITPPSSATFEGRASLSLYGQYSFVELERISSTVFAIKDIRDEYSITPTISFNGNSVGVSYSIQIGEVCVLKNQALVNCRVILTSKGTSIGRMQLNLVGAPECKAVDGNIAPGSCSFAGISTTGFFQGICLQGTNQVVFESVSTGGVAVPITDVQTSDTMVLLFAASYPI